MIRDRAFENWARLRAQRAPVEYAGPGTAERPIRRSL